MLDLARFHVFHRKRYKSQAVKVKVKGESERVLLGYYIKDIDISRYS